VDQVYEYPFFFWFGFSHVINCAYMNVREKPKFASVV